jgi:hypothetical protein
MVDKNMEWLDQSKNGVHVVVHAARARIEQRNLFSPSPTSLLLEDFSMANEDFSITNKMLIYTALLGPEPARSM